jgi:hypothetical protein
MAVTIESLSNTLIAPKQVDVCRNLGWESGRGVDEPKAEAKADACTTPLFPHARRQHHTL